MRKLIITSGKTTSGKTTSGKTNLDIFWLNDKNLADLDNLLNPVVLTDEIIENLEASLASFKKVMATINGENKEKQKVKLRCAEKLEISSFVEVTSKVHQKVRSAAQAKLSGKSKK